MKKSGEKFLNPYYFIPFPEKKTVYTREAGETYTGKITYQLKTRTPLFIPNSSCDRAFKDGSENHKTYDFFSYRELPYEGNNENHCYEPVIPGSEIRGMFRSVYEAVSGSCLSIVNDEMLITNRIAPYEAFRPGLLKRRGNKIYLVGASAAYIEKGKVDKYRDGDKLFFRCKKKGMREYVEGDVWKEPAGNVKSQGVCSGYLLKGELDPPIIRDKKKYMPIFFIQENSRGGAGELHFDGELKKKLEEVLDAYQKDSGLYGGYRQAYEEFLKDKTKECFPVYQLQKRTKEEKSIVHLSPACITKKSYNNRVRDLAKNVAPCRQKEKLCPACSLFGMVSEGQEGEACASASRLRFTDARLKEQPQDYKKLYIGKVTLQELASPKISNAQMYLRHPNGAADWNYDYWSRNRDIHSYEARLNGRKFYWHHVNPKLVQADKTERNVTVRPLRAGVTFTGNIYFENISKKELNQILFLCNISRQGEYGYKLGMGKPLGLGSVEMRVETAVTRTFDASAEDFYIEKPLDAAASITYEQAGFLTEQHIKEQFFKLMDFTITKGCTISYPYTARQAQDEKMKEGFEWFRNNKNAKEKEYLMEWDGSTREKLPFLRVRVNRR